MSRRLGIVVPDAVHDRLALIADRSGLSTAQVARLMLAAAVYDDDPTHEAPNTGPEDDR